MARVFGDDNRDACGVGFCPQEGRTFRIRQNCRGAPFNCGLGKFRAMDLASGQGSEEKTGPDLAAIDGKPQDRRPLATLGPKAQIA